MGTPYTGQYWPVLSIAWRLKQEKKKKKRGNSYIDLKSKINIELILLTFSLYYSRRRCMIRASICCPLKISKSKHSKSAGV